MFQDANSNATAQGRRALAARTRNIAIASGAIVLAIGAAITVASSSASASSAASAAPSGAERAAERLDAIAGQFANLQAIAFETDITLHLVESLQPGISADTLIEGSFSYMASGDMWRKRSYLDPEHYPGMNNEKAFDGDFYQNHLLGEENVLGVSVGQDDKPAGMTLYNPLFLYAQFLVPLKKGPEDVLPRHVRNAADAWDGSDLLWESTLSPHGNSHETIVPGATHNGLPYNVRVIMPEDETAPIVMETALEDGTLLTSTTFSRFVQTEMFGQAQSWPSRVVVEMSMGSPEPQGTLVMELRDIRTGEQAPREKASYMLDWETATNIWNDDDRTLIR